jgi:F-type H+-transporting ATPase subunit delta
MAEAITIARPYARAAFDLAERKRGGLGRWSDMLQVAAMVAEEPTMRQLLSNPRLSAEEKGELIIEICDTLYGEKNLLKQGANFIRLLAENHRLTELPEIAAIFEELRADAQKTIQAQLISAFPVNDEQRNKIVQSLNQRLQRDVQLECLVDESLLGGAIIRAGDLVIDGSAQGQLTKLATALSH